MRRRQMFINMYAETHWYIHTYTDTEGDYRNTMNYLQLLFPLKFKRADDNRMPNSQFSN